MGKNVTVVCKLPHGFELEHPNNPSKSITINGRNKAIFLGADGKRLEYGITEVDEDFWGAWFAANKNLKAIKSGAIFVAKSEQDAKSMAEEFKDRKTGLEPMRKDGKDPRARGVAAA